MIKKTLNKNKKKTSLKNKIIKKSNQDFSALKKYLRVVNFIAAAQLYLKDNFFLERELRSEDIKTRLLGHWGGATGVNFLLSHLNFYLKENQKTNPKLRDIIFLLGPGHAFPALQANLFLEKTLSFYFDNQDKNIKNIYDFNLSYNKEGLTHLIKNFGSPAGFPTHASPVTPGAILEGGELGYSISNASGAVMDNKDLIAVTMVGDGEAETASLATSWHSSKFINSKDNGVVLPVLNLNGYKISGPTIFGRMTDEDLTHFFLGLGYEPHILDARSDTNIYANKDNYDIEKDNVHILMQDILDKSFKKIIEMKKTGEVKGLPMIILKSDKGWTGPKTFKGVKIEGNFESHQVPFPNAKVNNEERKALEVWLKSYKIQELFANKDIDAKKILNKRLKEDEFLFLKEIEDIIPEKMWRVGMNLHVQQNSKKKLKELKLPSLTKVFKNSILDTKKDWNTHSPMNVVGEYLKEVFILNDASKNFRFFSPDETYSNKLEAVFKAEKRAWTEDTRPWDKDLSKRGRIVEMLSENTLIGMMMGYTLTGRYGFFASYEAFVQVVASMVDQYLKFLKVSQTINWRGDVGGFNIILTAPGWLQEHNGYSHQNPGFVDDMLSRNSDLVDVYFPMDAVSAGFVVERMCKSKNKINILCAGKDDARPIFLSEVEAKKNIENGMSIIKDYSDKLNNQESFDLIVCGVGDYLVLECLAGIDFVNEAFKTYGLNKERKLFKIGFLNISKLSAGDEDSRQRKEFNEKLSKNIKGAKVFANFHGHPGTLERFFFEADMSKNDVEVRGYIERGGITTLLDMHILNETSRYHVAGWIIENLFELKKIDKLTRDFIQKEIRKNMEKEVDFINKYFIDSDKIKNWKFNN
ncbi:MAG: phosphoketolase family protein [Candidatus Pacebacteria bacterium]|nr:phosphoketolase family protein [Candidatus Paceibacterota bacterium]